MNLFYSKQILNWLQINIYFLNQMDQMFWFIHIEKPQRNMYSTHENSNNWKSFGRWVFHFKIKLNVLQIKKMAFELNILNCNWKYTQEKSHVMRYGRKSTFHPFKSRIFFAKTEHRDMIMYERSRVALTRKLYIKRL